MTPHRQLWTPPNVNRGGWKEGNAPDVSDLSDEIPGPDARYQDHGPGCRCGSMECPWYRGEETARRYRSLSSERQRELATEVWDSFRSPEGWRIENQAAMLRAMQRPRRRWRFR